MNLCKCTRLVVLGIFLMLLTASMALTAEVCPIDRSEAPHEIDMVPTELAQPVLLGEGRQDYEAELRLYVVEPLSRYKDYSNKQYHMGLLDFALDTYITMNSGDRHRWSGTFSYAGLQGNNVMVIAVMTDPTPQATAYSNPPSGNPFIPYYVDATAGAEAGHADSNKTSAGYTHTVFIEKSTAQWCSACPTARYFLNQAHELGTENFQFVALVTDLNSVADARRGVYNQAYMPTLYGDGGYANMIGSYGALSYYVDLVQDNGARPVNDVGLLVGVEWNDAENRIDIELAYAHETPVNTMIASIDAPVGATDVLWNSYNDYTVSATDAEGDEFWYMYDWGDDNYSEWLGPYNSGDNCIQPYSWSDLGTYSVMVKAKDIWNYETPWSPVTDVNVFCCEVVGDVAIPEDGTILVNDIVFLVNYLFKGGSAPTCLDEGDCAVPKDGSILVNDIVWLVNYLFKGGTAPADC